MIIILSSIVLVVASWLGAGYARRTVGERIYAHECYVEAKGRLEALGQRTEKHDIVRQAVAIFKEGYRARFGQDYDRTDGALYSFIGLHSKVDEERPYKDKLRGSPPELINDRQCKKCIEELVKGWAGPDGARHAFHSLSHAASMRELCPTVSKCRAKYRTDFGMWKRLCKFDANLYHIKQTVKSLLPQTLCEARVRDCRILMEKPDSYFKRIFWLDAYTLFFSPKGGYVIGHRLHPELSLLEKEDVTWYDGINHKRHTIKVTFYAMVNWFTGPCAFWACQGSTGVKPVYRVSTISLALQHTGGVVLHACHHCTPQGMCPSWATVP